MLRALAHGLTAIAWAFTGPLNAAPDIEKIDLDAERAAIEQFQAADQKLQDIGWRLARSNAEFCDNAMPAVGLQLQDLASYSYPEIARAALEMEGDFSVQTAAKGSPAAASGEFAQNREVVRLGEVDPNTWKAGERRHWQRLSRAHDWIDTHLETAERLEVTFADGSTSELEPVPVCPSRFTLASGTDKVRANGVRVFVGIETPAFGYEEELFAALIAHELAHNLLGHDAWLDRNSRKRRNVKLIEREADRLMPWLLANAGYDPRAAIHFFEKFKPSSGSVLFIPGTHDKWQDRAAAVEAEIMQIEPLLTESDKADWSQHFDREIDPDEGLERDKRD